MNFKFIIYLLVFIPTLCLGQNREQNYENYEKEYIAFLQRLEYIEALKIYAKTLKENQEVEDIRQAIKLALKYLNNPDGTEYTLVYKSPSLSLRNSADFLEQKEKDLIFIEEVFKKLLKDIE